MNPRTFAGRNYTAPDMNASWSNADLEMFLFFNNEKVYTTNTNKSNIKLCTICLNNFEIGSKVRIVPNCQHIFHSNCIIESIIHSSGTPKCPICNANLLLQIANEERKILSEQFGGRRQEFEELKFSRHASTTMIRQRQREE